MPFDCTVSLRARWNRAKLSLKQRRDRVRQKKEAYLRKLQEEAA